MFVFKTTISVLVVSIVLLYSGKTGCFVAPWALNLLSSLAPNLLTNDVQQRCSTYETTLRQGHPDDKQATLTQAELFANVLTEADNYRQLTQEQQRVVADIRECLQRGQVPAVAGLNDVPTSSKGGDKDDNRNAAAHTELNRLGHDDLVSNPTSIGTGGAIPSNQQDFSLASKLGQSQSTQEQLSRLEQELARERGATVEMNQRIGELNKRLGDVELKVSSYLAPGNLLAPIVDKLVNEKAELTKAVRGQLGALEQQVESFGQDLAHVIGRTAASLPAYMSAEKHALADTFRRADQHVKDFKLKLKTHLSAILGNIAALEAGQQTGHNNYNDNGAAGRVGGTNYPFNTGIGNQRMEAGVYKEPADIARKLLDILDPHEPLVTRCKKYLVVLDYPGQVTEQLIEAVAKQRQPVSINGGQDYYYNKLREFGSKLSTSQDMVARKAATELENCLAEQGGGSLSGYPSRQPNKGSHNYDFGYPSEFDVHHRNSDQYHSGSYRSAPVANRPFTDDRARFMPEMNGRYS